MQHEAPQIHQQLQQGNSNHVYLMSLVLFTLLFFGRCIPSRGNYLRRIMKHLVSEVISWISFIFTLFKGYKQVKTEELQHENPL